jgi:hypothetical protein
MPQSAGTAFEPLPRQRMNGLPGVSMPQSAGTAFEHFDESFDAAKIQGFNASIGRYCI